MSRVVHRPFRRRVGLLIACWACVVACAMGALERYRVTPASVARAAPTTWPSDTHVQRDPERLTLLMSLHPHCPCSRASLTELDVLMARSNGRVVAQVVFVEPADAPAGWANTDLWRQARAIPNVTVRTDRDGRDSDAFASGTSGEVRLYDPQGRLLFSGGITQGRGHAGDNAGVDAILALCQGAIPATALTPVYGCRLINKKCSTVKDR